MSDESWLDDPDYMDAYWEGDDQGIACDYGLTEFCDNPDLRSLNCCFECETYLEACEIQEGVYDFAFFWWFTEKGWWADEYDPSRASDTKRTGEVVENG